MREWKWFYILTGHGTAPVAVANVAAAAAIAAATDAIILPFEWCSYFL